jgi:Tfp pilus assembly protein PilF
MKETPCGQECGMVAFLGWWGIGACLMWRITFFAILILSAFIFQAKAEKKVALVVGNGDYAENLLGALPNSKRDAKLIADALVRDGFTLVGDKPQIDLDRPMLIAMINVLKETAKDADMAVFYFSGHGIGVSGVNYIVPTNLPTFVSPETLGANSLNANYVLAQLEESRAHTKVMLIDACRIPFKGFTERFEGASSKTGLVISLAAQPNASASPGAPGKNSPYSTALNTYLDVKGLDVYKLLNEVSLAVAAATKNTQVPWVLGSGVETSIVFKAVPPGLSASLTATINIGNPAPTPAVAPIQTGRSIPFVQKAATQLEQKDYSGARATLAEGMAAEPNSALPYSYRGYSWYREGTLLKNMNDSLDSYRKGLADLDVAIRLDPQYAPSRRHRGNTNVAIYKALKEMGKPTGDFLNRGIQDLEGAVGLSESKTNANALGEAYLIRGSYVKAIESFNNAIARDRSYAAPYSGICLAYRMQDDLNTAREYARKAAARDDGLKSWPCLNLDKKKALQSVTADNS